MATNHPHLEVNRAIIGIPPVRPGDYVFWHCDLVRGVDQMNKGKNDSSVFYNVCKPLTRDNADTLIATRSAFLETNVPIDFTRGHGSSEREFQHQDHEARLSNILTHDGMRAIGLMPFDENEQGLTSGQKKVRRLANLKLGHQRSKDVS
jgi:hypothetical protein